MKTIYFDHAATTPLDSRVLDEMMPFLKNEFGNANSAHHLGQKAKVAVESARNKVAELIGAEPSEIIFTSGGTESDNAAINGVLAISGNKKEIITSKLEHHAVLHPVEFGKLKGYKPIYIQPSQDCEITAEAVAGAITENTALVSLMHINNEIGVINPIDEIAAVCAQRKVPFHSDTVQSLGKIPVNVKNIRLDFLSGSAHKIYGPKGIGILYVRNGAPWMPWMQGGSQEKRRRGGTLNVPGIVGFAKALELAISEQDENTKKYQSLRRLLLSELQKSVPGKFRVNGEHKNFAPHIINISFYNDSFRGVDGEMLILNLDIDGICVSNGSACTSGAVEASHVLMGIGIEEDVAKSSVRVSLGKSNTEEDILYFVDKISKVLNRMYSLT